ncbi:uncharacterized protein LOC112054388 [Bicyclus anynana]|uniref:Uncharacterized protein LOC112054388 n=1 Tax=Bicyclus anynana TaxID=110368 RepID=A0A6J1P1E7_BICAN|nr:uncharacterized protein LOC112054388 [Bicyclus anynana]
MVGIAQKTTQSKMDAVMQVMKYMERVQQQFQELHHLVNMMHEIETKYGYRPQEHRPDYIPEVYAEADDMIKRIDEINKIRHLEKIEKLREAQKIRDALMGKISTSANFSGHTTTRRTPRDRYRGNGTGSRWWPIDYGWEIDYKWFD